MEVREEFNQLSGRYTEVISRWLPHYRQLTGGLMEFLPAGFKPERILDLGCGNGNVTALLMQRYPDAAYTLLDASEDMLQLCEQRFGGKLQLETVTSFFQEAALPEQHFDLITAGITLHHLKGPEKAAVFQKIYHWLRPGGYFTLSDLCIDRKNKAHNQAVMQHWEAGARALGTTDEEWAHVMDHHASLDFPDSINDHLDWLRKAGFAQAAVPWQSEDAWAVLQCRR